MSHLYHSPRRPTWFGCLQQIRDRTEDALGERPEVTFAGNSPYTFTIESDIELPDAVLDAFELERVDEAPDA